jgi:hypothetical protein
VISDSSSSCFAGKILFCASVATPFSFKDAILNFTTEGNLLLHDGHGTTIWSTETSNKSNMSLASGNLVLFYQNNSRAWQSFDHPRDILVMGQSLCRGMNLSAKPTSTKWKSSKVYLSAMWNGLQYSFEPAAFTQLFQAESGLQLRLTQTTPISTSTPSICYTFANGSLGFPEKIFTLPSASSLQFMRLESDGHLRLYGMQEAGKARMLIDVSSMVMDFCDYPLACGDYSVCNNGQCSCPSFSHFRFQNDRLPGAGCIPVSNISCNHAHDHQLIPLNDVSYFSYSLFLSKAPSGYSQTVHAIMFIGLLLQSSTFSELWSWW